VLVSWNLYYNRYWEGYANSTPPFLNCMRLATYLLMCGTCPDLFRFSHCLLVDFLYASHLTSPSEPRLLFSSCFP
jgi:hypothetical protein